jgi:hypothetical protein
MNLFVSMPPLFPLHSVVSHSVTLHNATLQAADDEETGDR